VSGALSLTDIIQSGVFRSKHTVSTGDAKDILVKNTSYLSCWERKVGGFKILQSNINIFLISKSEHVKWLSDIFTSSGLILVNISYASCLTYCIQ
jgi:hypothetical protein